MPAERKAPFSVRNALEEADGKNELNDEPDPHAQQGQQDEKFPDFLETLFALVGRICHLMGALLGQIVAERRPEGVVLFGMKRKRRSFFPALIAPFVKGAKHSHACIGSVHPTILISQIHNHHKGHQLRKSKQIDFAKSNAAVTMVLLLRTFIRIRLD